MRVLMLGWEFPPFISGGLGTACYGLTRAMSKQGTQVLFVLPKAVEAEYIGHIRLLSPDRPHTPSPDGSSPAAQSSPPAPADAPGPATVDGDGHSVFDPNAPQPMRHVTFKQVPTWLQAYQTPRDYKRSVAELKRIEALRRGEITEQAFLEQTAEAERQAAAAAAGGESDAAEQQRLRPAEEVDYAGDVITESQRYADLCMKLTRREQFDVIHAHDWMTYPAGMAIAGASGKPLVVHVHSTEYDRSGESIHTQIYDVERRGMHAAARVVCVSHLTRKICEHRYGVPHEKVRVVYNGIEHGEDQPVVQPQVGIERGDKIVLFLGRLTMQKGPEYFLRAARKVLDKFDRAKFLIAGSGDMARQTIQQAAELGIGHKVLFTGFLRGADVERVFRMADVYVMPSVSEPFGIAPLEAIRHDVPVIISKNSGVAEVIRHALKVDFWDVDEMANKIIAVLRHPPLGRTLREEADFEIRQLTWDGAAAKCNAIYEQAIADVSESSPPTEPIIARR
jgi:glycosyltransferase involved in cell wall biosynthesis